MNSHSFIGNHRNCGAFHKNEETPSQILARTFLRKNNEEPPEYKSPIQYCDVTETKIRKVTGVRQSGGSEEKVTMYEAMHQRETLLLYGIPLEDHRLKRRKTHERPYIPEAPYIPESDDDDDPPPRTHAKKTLRNVSSSASSSSPASGNGGNNKVQ